MAGVFSAFPNATSNNSIIYDHLCTMKHASTSNKTQRL